MRRGTKRPNSAMTDSKKRKLGLLLFLTVQVVSLAVLEYQQQMDASQSVGGECPSLTMQLLVPVLTLWESMRSTAILARLRRSSGDRSSSSDDGSESEGEEEGEGGAEQDGAGHRPLQNGNAGNKRRKQDPAEGSDQLATVLMGCGEAVKAAFAEHTLGHNECSSKNGELDRVQRKEHSDQLIGVLEHLANIMGQIAEKW